MWQTSIAHRQIQPVRRPVVNLRSFCVLGACAMLFHGCAVFQTMRDGTRQVVKDFTPESLDEANPADDPGDPWISAAASEGRQEQKSESANDPLHLRQYFLSNKARAIENNVGIAEDE
jgi:hypothetical protein